MKSNVSRRLAGAVRYKYGRYNTLDYLYDRFQDAIEKQYMIGTTLVPQQQFTRAGGFNELNTVQRVADSREAMAESVIKSAEPEITPTKTLTPATAPKSRSNKFRDSLFGLMLASATQMPVNSPLPDELQTKLGAMLPDDQKTVLDSINHIRNIHHTRKVNPNIYSVMSNILSDSTSQKLKTLETAPHDIETGEQVPPRATPVADSKNKIYYHSINGAK